MILAMSSWSTTERMEYDSILSRWVLVDPRLNVIAMTRAISNSFALSMLQREIQPKLTAFKEEAFTCDDGQLCRKLLYKYNLSSSID